MFFDDNNGHLNRISVYNWDYSEIEKHAKNGWFWRYITIQWIGFLG